MATTEKIRRRSSLAPTRIGIDLTPETGKGLYKNVDASLPPEKRLEELSRIAVKYAVDKCSQNTENEDKKEFYRDVKYDLHKAIDSAEFQEAAVNACKTNRTDVSQESSCVYDVEYEENVKLMENRIQKLKKEEQDWTSYIAEMAEKAEEARLQEEKTTLQASDLTLRQITLSQKYMPELPNLEALREQIDRAKKKFYILTCQHENNVNSLTQLHYQIRRKAESVSDHLEGRMVGGMQSPKATMERLMEFPTP